MCRHLAYLGPPVTLASLVLDPPHSLYRQSWAPADMRGGGSVNADGFGLGWYSDDSVVRYRRSVPIWADESLPELAASITSGAVLAAVRNGTVGAPLTETAVAPFTKNQWLFSHNGLISNWPSSVSKLAEALPTTELLTLDAPMDSALIWALVQHRLHLGAPEAVASVVRDIAAAAPDSRLNLLLTDGEQLVATTWTHSLWTRRTTDAIAVSSEPWTTTGWEQVPDHSLLIATKDTLAVTSLMEGRL
ncbi:ergothioneine biosynthesis protein EgtC [Kribbella sp. NPDC056861]|uniref:ergothioneine biosynthesis protein EgtC n=1 Tax=Kribbella sp. NPDC056861 TaxID=3154857 RepID=UPI0034393B44